MEEQEDEKDTLISQLYDEVDRLQGAEDKGARNTSLANYPQKKDSNLISVQLDTIELLQKLERFYRGDYLKTDEETGDVYWAKQENEDLIPLNDYGVSMFMESVTKYIDKNTVLSNYTEERIYEILGDLGDELTLFVSCNYEMMGMDTNFKKTKFRMLIVTTLHLIESSYRRAIDGRTIQDLNQSRIVSQSDMIGRHNQMMPPKKKSGFWGMFDPRVPKG